MKKIFTFLIAVFAIGLAKAGTFGMGDYVWKDDATQTTLKKNDAFVKNDRQPIDLEMAIGMWTFFETEVNGTIVLQYARGNANNLPYVAGANGDLSTESPNLRLNWITINTDSIGKDWVLARDFSSLTEGDYTPSGLADYTGLAAYKLTTAEDPDVVAKTHVLNFGGKTVTSIVGGGITLDGTTTAGFVSGDYNYMKGAIRFAIMPGSTIQPDSVYSFRLYTTAGRWDGNNVDNVFERTINFNKYEGDNNRIKTHSADGQPDPSAVNDGNHFDNGIPFILTGPNIATAVLPVKWTAPGLQASVVNGSVKLTWGTESESNNKGFVVERSVNGAASFTKVATVASQATGGVSTSTLNYSFTDAAPVAKAVYRVGEVAANGKVLYSNSVSVSLNGDNAALSVYPNPVATAFLTVKGAAAGSVYRIVSINGINAAKGVINAAGKVSVSHLASGVYALQVAAADGSVKSVMFVKK